MKAIGPDEPRLTGLVCLSGEDEGALPRQRDMLALHRSPVLANPEDLWSDGAVHFADHTDAQVVARCRLGDQAAWAELVERYSRYVWAIAVQAYRLREEDAEDVFQDVFARTYQHLGRLRSDEAIRPWVGQLTRRLSIDRIRASGRENVACELPESGEPDEALERLAEAMDVRAALTSMPDHCREILDRFFVQDQSYETISDSLGIPSGTIGSRISRCLAQLRELLESSEQVGVT